VARNEIRVVSLLAAFILGLACGAAGINSVIGYRIDELIIRQRGLEERLASSQKELIQVKKNLEDQQSQTLTSINVHVYIKDQDELTKLEREQIKIETIKSVKQKLGVLLGQELGKLDCRQIALIINGRQITFNEQKYEQKVDLVVVTDQLDIYVTTWPE